MESFANVENKRREAFDGYIKMFHLTDEDLAKPLLDVGAGDGQFVHYLRHELGNYSAYGVEMNPAKIASHEEGMVVADGLKLPFADETFELVLTKNYLPMFVGVESEMQEALREILRVTMHGGRVIGDVATPDGVMSDLEENRRLKGYNQNMETWFLARYSAAQKLVLFWDKLREGGMEVKVEGEVVTIYKQ